MTGIIQSETQTSVTVRPAVRHEPDRAAVQRIARLLRLERSMMPDGLEEGLSLQDMADLLQFIRNP